MVCDRIAKSPIIFLFGMFFSFFTLHEETFFKKSYFQPPFMVFGFEINWKVLPNP